jgi:hypothetical protein
MFVVLFCAIEVVDFAQVASNVARASKMCLKYLFRQILMTETRHSQIFTSWLMILYRVAKNGDFAQIVKK